jgi:LacI family transcriptional regulator
MGSRFISLKTIAEKAGVSTATVSMALRARPEIPVATQKKIRRLANRLGYRRDPQLAVLMKYLRSNKKSKFRSCIGYLTNFPQKGLFHNFYTYEQFYRGACLRAEELGYGLTEFWLGDPQLSPDKISSVLRSQGIQGLLFAPAPEKYELPQLNWKAFSTVVIGQTQWPMPLNCVCNHQSQSMRLVLDSLRNLGYRRLGMAISASTNETVNQNWLSAFLADQHTRPASERVSPFITSRWNLETFRAWLNRERPDALIGLPNPLLLWLRQIGTKVPEDLGFAGIDLWPWPEFPHIAGIDQNHFMVGYEATSIVASHLESGHIGLANTVKVSLISGTWRDGVTAPPNQDFFRQRTLND